MPFISMVSPATGFYGIISNFDTPPEAIVAINII